MNENQVNGSAFPGFIYLPLNATSPTLTPTTFYATTPVRAYADPGTFVSEFIQFTDGAGSNGATCNYTIVGNLVTH